MFDQLHRVPSPQQQMGHPRLGAHPSLAAQDRPFNPSTSNLKKSHTKNPPFHPPSTSIPCLASSAHAPALPKTPSCRYKHAPTKTETLISGRGRGGAGDDVRQTYCVPHPAPYIRCLARSLPMLPAVGCCPATRSRPPVSEADWESCHVCPCINVRRAAFWWSGGGMHRLGICFGVFAGLLPRQEVGAGSPPISHSRRAAMLTSYR